MRIDLGDDDAVEVQMAPLIDCVFLLLVFFLVATTLKKINKELPVTLPLADAAVEVREEPDTLVLGIDREGKLYVNAQPATTTVLFDEIRAAKSCGATVRLDADKDTRYERVLEVLEMCHIQGIRDVGLHTAKGKVPN